MRKTSISLLFLLLLTLCFCSVFTFESSKAQNSTADRQQAAPVAALQDNRMEIPRLIRNAKAGQAVFVRRQLFRSQNRLFQADNLSVANELQLSSVVNDAAMFELDKPAAASLIDDNVGFLTLSLPDGKGGTVDLELIKVDIFAPGFSIKTATPTNESLDGALGVHYRGIVRGNEQSLAAISVFKDQVVGFFSTEADGNSVVGRLEGDNPTDTHIVYAEKDLKVTSEFSCETKDTQEPTPASLLEPPQELPGQCVRIYIEADFDLFQNKGTVTNTSNYLTALFNQSATLYANDGIPVTLSEIFVWNTSSPYTGLNTSTELLDKFGQVRTSFNGDFAHLVALRSNSGRAWINTFCLPASSRQAFSGINSSFQNVPTYSWSVEVFTHELGHSMGSRHTHDCAWNGNNTAIDGCGPAAGFPSEFGTCSTGPIPSMGTIMSYCHLSPNPGINFSLGFGPQPRNLIINRRDAATCLTNCGGFTIGQGAPNPQLFINAANRNNFLQFAKQPPTSAVHRWNCTTCDPNNSSWGKGLIQDFDDITPGVHDALMLADTNTNFVAQIYGGMWDKFIQLGGVDYNSANVRMIGYPIADRNCSDFNATCFTDAQLVSPFGTSYHYQRFQGGAFVLHRSGSRNAQTFEIHGPIRARWQALNGPDGSYGLPISDEYSSGGKRRSDFEGGSICFNPATNQTEDNCATQPANDNFANAQVISNSSGTTTGTNIGATKETGEPNHAGNVGGKSVWYRWQAPASGTVTITTGSNYDSLIGVYTGSSVSLLTLVASNDDDPNGGVSSRVSFTSNSGTTYRIAVDGFNGASGSINLNWSSVAVPNPPGEQPATNITTNSFTANWNSPTGGGTTGYRLDVSTSSTFTSFVSGYQNLDVGNVLSRSVTGLTPGTTYFYRVRAYNGNGTSGNSGTIQATTITNIQVSVQTNPSGLSFTVDGTTFTSAQTFTWSSGSSHTISTTSPQNGTAGTRFSFANWTDGGAISHSVSPTSNTTFTANFTTQHFLTMNAGTGGTVTPSSAWFNSGQVVSISASPAGGFSFSGWSGSGSGSFTGSSNPASVTMSGPITETATFTESGGQAIYDATLKAPKCAAGGSCDSGVLLNGRDTIASGNEPNQPNTINNSCPDGDSGTYHTDESIDRVRVSTLDGSNLAAGKTARIDVTLWAWSDPSQDHLDLYYAADAANPGWVYLTTLQPTVVGSQVLSTTYTLPPGGNLQAVRARMRFQGVVSPCTGISSFDDHDDLIFAVSSTSAINVALPVNGGVASASSTYSTNYQASNVINGERAGANSTTGGVFNGWLSGSPTMPQWLQVDFGQTRSIHQIDVLMVQDNYQNPSSPTLNLTFTQYGLQAFEVQYWNGSSWVAVPGGTVSGNNKTWKQFTFPALSTTRIRVLANASPDNYSRLTEVEAWSNTTTPPPVNVALPVNGGVATASSTYAANYQPSTVINGERAGANSTTGGVFNGWLSGSPTMPQWLQIDFGQTRSIHQIDVLMVQDNYQNPSPPTLNLTFTQYGLQAFEVQYWNGSSWVAVPGGSVSGNNKVWRQFSFPALSTTKIRVLTNASPDSYSRLTEVEAWSNPGP